MLVISLSVCADNGNSVFGFLDIPVSARVNALGGINISLVKRDLSITNQNPALLGQIGRASGRERGTSWGRSRWAPDH